MTAHALQSSPEIRGTGRARAVLGDRGRIQGSRDLRGYTCSVDPLPKEVPQLKLRVFDLVRLRRVHLTRGSTEVVPEIVDIAEIPRIEVRLRVCVQDIRSDLTYTVG